MEGKKLCDFMAHDATFHSTKRYLWSEVKDPRLTLHHCIVFCSDARLSLDLPRTVRVKSKLAINLNPMGRLCG